MTDLIREDRVAAADLQDAIARLEISRQGRAQLVEIAIPAEQVEDHLVQNKGNSPFEGRVALREERAPVVRIGEFAIRPWQQGHARQ